MLIAYSSKGQIAGISNDKLVVGNPQSINPRSVEFEPGFGYVWSKNSFNNNGKLESLNPENDSILVLQALAFRITYGFAKNFEIGTLITSSLDAFSLGIKYCFLNHEKFYAGAFLGTNFSNESDLVFRNTGIFGKTVGMVGGLVFMNKFGENKRFSLDYEAQYQNTFDNKMSFSDDIFAAAELGYEFKKGVQLATGFLYQFHNYKNGSPDAWRLTWNTGITIHPGKMFNLIANIPIDIMGKNTGRFSGFAIVLTIALD